MDGVGRFARSLTDRAAGAAWEALLRARAAWIAAYRRRRAEDQANSAEPYARPSAWAFWRRRILTRIANLHVPRRAGLVATLALFAGTGLFGIQRGGHWPEVNAALLEAGHRGANAVGLRVSAVRLTGNRQLSHEAVLAAAGITETTSVLFFDPDEARARLKANPWIADATVAKLYPDQLLIGVVERAPFALWQRDGRVAVIAEDGTVIVDHLDGRFLHLPFVVGQGADRRAGEIVHWLATRPELAGKVHAAILVAERRWTLVLTNGIDVRLPDADVPRALADLVRLDAEKKLMTRDVAVIDLRVPGRVSVRLSEDAVKAHEAALRERERARRRAGTRT